jgi:RNA polymerase sigma-70 factor (ECF subfamily)
MHDDRHARRARFEELYGAHVRPLLGFALRRTGQPADAADVVADTFLVAWRRLDDVPDRDARLWLYGVAHRVLANHGRGRRRRDRLGGRLAAVVAEHVVADPAEAVGVEAVVREAMDRLPADDQDVLRLAAWEGLGGAEIAVVLGVPAGTVRSRLRRARGRMRDALGSDPRGDGCDPIAGNGGAGTGHEGVTSERSPRIDEGRR